MLNVPQTPKEAKKILKEQGVSNAQKILERVLKRLGVKETSGKSKAVALEDVLDARKISEKVPVMLDARRILETLEVLQRASGNVYREWEKAKFDVNHWFEVDCLHERFSYTLLYLAIDFKLKNVLDALFEVKEININAKGPFSEWNALHWATEKGDIEVALKLIERGVNVNQLDSSERNALHWVTEKGDIEITEILVKNKADVNMEDLAKLTALYKAARNGHKEVVKILMANGADAKRNGTLKLTPLHIAVANNNKEMVVCLIKMDKNISENIEAVDVFGWTPLYWAAAKNNASILSVLLDAISIYSANVNIEDNLIGRSPLHVAAANGNLEAVRLLISYGASINQMDAWGWTAFDCAAERGNKEIIDFLIGNRANIETNDPCKIFLFTRSHNLLETTGTILQLGIWKDVMKLIGAESLCYAASKGDIQMIYTLLASGVNVNASADLKLIALHHAVKGGHHQAVEILILCEAAVNAQDNLGLTALHYAVNHKHWKVVETLISYRADLSLQDNCGETVRDLAESKGTSNLLRRAEERAQAACVKPSIAPRMEGEYVPLSLVNRIAHTQLEPNKIRYLADKLAHMQLEPNETRYLADELAHMQLESSAEACPGPSTKMNGIKERRANIKKRNLSTGSDSGSSTETDECNDKWSYGESSRATAVWKYGLFNR